MCNHHSYDVVQYYKLSLSIIFWYTKKGPLLEVELKWKNKRNLYDGQVACRNICDLFNCLDFKKSQWNEINFQVQESQKDNEVDN